MQNQNVETIDRELSKRLSAHGLTLEIENHPFGGNFTRFYKIKGEKVMVFNYKAADKKMIGNPVISASVLNDPKKAVDIGGRKGAGTFGKRVILKNIGTETREQYDYIVMLLMQLAK
ncbi:MAG: hypothetical protein HXY50_07325 [Ignavibacteriaceae bacterium]|nr:hypothetical protein [Ignavibacteriaceae bacterium]